MGAALSGIIVVIGENVCGMDPEVEIKNGKSSKARNWPEGLSFPGLAVWRLRRHCRTGQRRRYKPGMQEYAISELGVRTVEIKWGQGAKDIGGEVKINSLNVPSPFKNGAISCFRSRRPPGSRRTSAAPSKNSNAIPGSAWSNWNHLSAAEQLRSAEQNTSSSRRVLTVPQTWLRHQVLFRSE